MDIELPQALRDACLALTLVGSRATCNPAPTDTDCDILCWVHHEKIDALLVALEIDGWQLDGDERYPGLGDAGEGFQAFRKGELNLIMTVDGAFHQKFYRASALAKRFNLMDKADRIALFEAVLYDQHREPYLPDFKCSGFEVGEAFPCSDA